MTVSDIAEEIFRELQELIVEYLNKAQTNGIEAEEAKRQAYALLETCKNPNEVREAFLDMIEIVEGMTA